MWSMTWSIINALGTICCLLPDVCQVPGQINLKDLNIPARSLEQLQQDLQLSLSASTTSTTTSTVTADKVEGKPAMVFADSALAANSHLAELEDLGVYEQGYMEDSPPVPLDLDEPSDLKASERLEAFINKMMQKAEMLNTTREEQILKKQQILEELQKVEQELQEKAKAQLLLNAQEKLEQQKQKQAQHQTEQQEGEQAVIRTVPSLQEQSAAVACAQGPLPVHVAAKKQLLVKQIAVAKRDDAVPEEYDQEPKPTEPLAGAEQKEKFEESALDAAEGVHTTSPVDDSDQADGATEAEAKPPHLAKQESLGSASSGDSGCGNSDMTGAGKEGNLSEAADTTKTSQAKSTEGQAVAGSGVGQGHNDMVLTTNNIREGGDGQDDCDEGAEKGGSWASSEEVDLSNVIPILETAQRLVEQRHQQQQDQQQQSDQQQQQQQQQQWLMLQLKQGPHLTWDQHQEFERQCQQLALQQGLQQQQHQQQLLPQPPQQEQEQEKQQPEEQQQQQQAVSQQQVIVENQASPSLLQPLQLDSFQSLVNAAAVTVTAPGTLEQRLQQQRQLQAQLALHQQLKAQAQLQLQQQQAQVGLVYS